MPRIHSYRDELYYVIRSTEDGVKVYPYEEGPLMEALKPKPDGPGNWYCDFGHLPVEFADRFPSDIENTDEIVIIKGRVVVPKRRVVVIEYSLDEE